MRLLQLAGYNGPYGGSFLPMVRAALEAGQERGWSVEAILRSDMRERPWVAELVRTGLEVGFLEPGPTAGRPRRSRSASRRTGRRCSTRGRSPSYAFGCET